LLSTPDIPVSNARSSKYRKIKISCAVIVDPKQIPEERVRRGAKPCDKGCQKVFRRAFLLHRKERYRKAAGLPPLIKSTGGAENSLPEAVYAEACMATEVTGCPAET
jgi:hypothetical protein